MGRGGRRRRPPLVLVVLLLAAAALPGAILGAETAGAAGFPVASTGDIWFQADQAGFRTPDGGVVEEYYLRVAHNQLHFDPVEGARGAAPQYEGQAFVDLVFLDSDGNELGHASGTFSFRVADQEAALSADRVQLFVMREALHPRAAAVRVVMEDMKARKRGLIYMINKKKRNGTTEASLSPPPFSGSDFGLSDLQFAWSTEPGVETSPFLKRGLNVVPNPGRNYGLYLDSLHVYYEVYDLKPAGGLYVDSLAILDEAGRRVAVAIDTVSAPGGTWVHTPAFSVRKLPAGTYDLAVSVTDLGDRRAARTARTFNVVWNESSWGRTEKDVLDEARVLLTGEEYERFREMQSGDRETFLANFWAARDPSGSTARNELRELFLARVDFANRNFSTSFEKGLVSDRGRIYIRYGQPDEITREVLPQIGSTLSDVLSGVDEDRPELSRLKSESSMIDTRPYEIWTYTRQGEPLFPERETSTPNTGLTFIFVDEQGIGNYTLRYSSAFKKY